MRRSSVSRRRFSASVDAAGLHTTSSGAEAQSSTCGHPRPACRDPSGAADISRATSLRAKQARRITPGRVRDLALMAELESPSTSGAPEHPRPWELLERRRRVRAQKAADQDLLARAAAFQDQQTGRQQRLAAVQSRVNLLQARSEIGRSGSSTQSLETQARLPSAQHQLHARARLCHAPAASVSQEPPSKAGSRRSSGIPGGRRPGGAD